MACNISLSGLGIDCARDYSGGIKEVYIIENQNISAITLNTTKDKITGITTTTSTSGGTASGSTVTNKFKTYKFRRETATLNTTLNVTNAPMYSTELVLSFNKYDTTKRIEIAALAKGELSIIVRTVNDAFFYMGYDYPVEVTAGTVEFGQKMEDNNGMSLTFTDISKQPIFEMETTTLSTILDGNQSPLPTT